MIPKAFLSCAAEDSDFVDRVYRHLPHGQAFFFRQSFANGSLMLDAMERAVSTTQLFVFFASKTSVQKAWVNFELAHARLTQIAGTGKKILIFPCDSSTTFTNLSPWMQLYWVDAKVRNARDIARTVSHELNELVGLTRNEMFGRGALQDTLRRRFNDKRKSLGGFTAPNIIVASGVEQIGRETLLRNTAPMLYPTLPEIARGPVKELLPWADLKDLYRAVRELVEDDFDLSRYEKDA